MKCNSCLLLQPDLMPPGPWSPLSFLSVVTVQNWEGWKKHLGTPRTPHHQDNDMTRKCCYTGRNPSHWPTASTFEANAEHATEAEPKPTALPQSKSFAWRGRLQLPCTWPCSNGRELRLHAALARRHLDLLVFLGHEGLPQIEAVLPLT